MPVLLSLAAWRAVRPLFLQSGHSQYGDASRSRLLLALSLLAWRMESKNFDESIAMADYDNATRKASSLDIAKPSLSIRH
jgi:hypothetical protein